MSRFRENNIISRLKWIFYIYRFNYKLRKKAKSKNKDWIFGRVACMGQDVLKLTGSQTPLYNIQKGRVDYLYNLHHNTKLHTKTSKVVEFMSRKDIIPLIAQQEIFEWKSIGLPKLIFMDSYSELTDQLFVNREKHWCFCSNYSDLLHTPEFTNNFEVKGLIAIEDIENQYRDYFELLRERFPDTPIIFMHFPVKLDNREKFKIRYRSIQDAIERISKEFPHFYSISVDEKIIDWPEEKLPGIENFPYHFNNRTYQDFAEQIQSIDIFNEY